LNLPYQEPLYADRRKTLGSGLRRNDGLGSWRLAVWLVLVRVILTTPPTSLSLSFRRAFSRNPVALNLPRQEPLYADRRKTLGSGLRRNDGLGSWRLAVWLVLVRVILTTPPASLSLSFRRAFSRNPVALNLPRQEPLYADR